MSDFERTRMGVLGREVTVTSWLDPQTGVWRASAPGVTLETRRSSTDGHESRQAAIAQIARELEHHYLTSPASPPARK